MIKAVGALRLKPIPTCTSQQVSDMMTLSGQKILVVGGTSGVGFAVAKLSLLSVASHVIVASSTASKVEGAVSHLQAIITEYNLPGKVTGDVLLTATKYNRKPAVLMKPPASGYILWP